MYAFIVNVLLDSNAFELHLVQWRIFPTQRRTTQLLFSNLKERNLCCSLVVNCEDEMTQQKIKQCSKFLLELQSSEHSIIIVFTSLPRGHVEYFKSTLKLKNSSYSFKKPRGVS